MLRTPGGFLSRFTTAVTTTRTPQYQALQPAEEEDDEESSNYSLTDDPEGRLASSRRKNREGGHVTVTPEDDRRVLRSIDLVILPIMLTVYFLQSIDKSALAYSSMFGLIEDTGLEGDQYGWLNSIVYVAQLIMQPPLAWLLVRLPIARFTSVMVFAWVGFFSFLSFGGMPVCLIARRT